MDLKLLLAGQKEALSRRVFSQQIWPCLEHSALRRVTEALITLHIILQHILQEASYEGYSETAECSKPFVAG